MAFTYDRLMSTSIAKDSIVFQDSMEKTGVGKKDMIRQLTPGSVIPKVAIECKPAVLEQEGTFSTIASALVVGVGVEVEAVAAAWRTAE